MPTIRVSLTRNPNNAVGWRRPSDFGIPPTHAKYATKKLIRSTLSEFNPPGSGCCYVVKPGKCWTVWRVSWRGPNLLPVVKLVAKRKTEQEAEAVVMGLVG